MEFIRSITYRRSFYHIEKKSTITDERLLELIELATQYTPSAFHCQSQMVLLLLGDKHNKFWDITIDALSKIVPPDKFASTEQKILSFKAGYGTVLYFNDDKITNTLQKNYPLYSDKFPIFADQANGMLQFAIWNLLEAEGLGASLQHYNPLIDHEIKSEFHISEDWRLIAQMPFGVPVTQPDAKEFLDIKTRVRLLK